jgi:hypothetical protein
MARFESTGQICLFLIGSALVSLVIIVVLQAEAERRYGRDSDVDVIEVIQVTEIEPIKSDGNTIE